MSNQPPDMVGPLPDWIQAIAVVVGVYFGIQEFVLKDRAEDRVMMNCLLLARIGHQLENRGVDSVG